MVGVMDTPESLGFERVGGEPLSIPFNGFFSPPTTEGLEGNGGGLRPSKLASDSNADMECRCNELSLSILVTGNRVDGCEETLWPDGLDLRGTPIPLRKRSSSATYVKILHSR